MFSRQRTYEVVVTLGHESHDDYIVDTVRTYVVQALDGQGAEEAADKRAIDDLDYWDGRGWWRYESKRMI